MFIALNQGELIELFQAAMNVAFKLAAPMLITSLVVGLVVAVFQAATQIHEQTLTFLPKLLVIALALLLLGSWMMTLMTDFFNMIFEKIAGM